MNKNKNNNNKNNRINLFYTLDYLQLLIEMKY